MGSQQQATIRFVVSTADAEHDLKLFHKRVEAETKRQQESQIKAQASPENVRYQKDAEFHAEKLYKLKRQERDMVEAEDTRHYMAMKKQEDYDKRVAGGVGSGKMAGALSGFGGKMLLGHAAGIAAGDILGDQHGGRELGAIAGAAMFGGPWVVAAVAGMELIGTAFRTHRENLLAAQKAGQDYGNTLMSLASTWSGFATGLVERNSFGKAMEGEFNRALVASEKFQQERDVLDTQTSGVMSFGEAIDKILINETPGSEIARKNMERQADIEMDTAKEAEKFRDTSYEKQKERQADELKNRKTWYSALNEMRPGRQKEELELSAKHSMDFEKRKNKEAQDEEMAEAGIKRAQYISDKANELKRYAKTKK